MEGSDPVNAALDDVLAAFSASVEGGGANEDSAGASEELVQDADASMEDPSVQTPVKVTTRAGLEEELELEIISESTQGVSTQDAGARVEGGGANEEGAGASEDLVEVADAKMQDPLFRTPTKRRTGQKLKRSWSSRSQV